MEPKNFAREWTAAEQGLAETTSCHGAGIPGTIQTVSGHSVLVLAPHALHHRRSGRAKKVEPGTGGLVLTLARATGASALVPTGPIENPDQWADRDDAFAQELRRLTLAHQLLIEVRGMPASHGFDICIGMRSGISTRPMAATGRVLRHLRGLRVGVNTPLTGQAEHTVSSLPANLNTLALQVELSPAMREPGSPAGPALAAAIEDLMRNHSS